MQFFAPLTRSLIAWALLPLALLSGMPLAVCVCANGEQKLFCQRIYGGRNHESAAKDNTCCLSRVSVPVAKTRSCCQPSAESSKENCNTSISGHCCKSSVELPSPRISTESVAAPDDLGQIALLPRLSIYPARHSASTVSSLADLGNLPPPDLLALHCVLQI